mmetsp:Transcript_13251/g.2066  ORF Transcript_13251/g.2066 Transcript_13251/m.2066 type:complete len:83 (+) Transcript_13251:3191-3439(+)
MNDGDFFGRCLNFPKDEISNLTLRKLAPYIQDEKFNPKDVANVSKAAGSLCAWAIAMDQYAKVSRNVEPKRIKLAEAEENLR